MMGKAGSGRRWKMAVVASGLLVLAGNGSALAQGSTGGRRVALVVGNDAYQAQAALANAVNDARAVANALTAVGFSVTKLEDATRVRLTSALVEFGRSLGDDDVALFYYAGHGVQVDRENYLLPTDYTGQSETSVRLDAIGALDVQEMLRPARVAMLVFDACRNNPYRGTRGGGSGLAPMEARGTLIAYAAGAGEVASDAARGSATGLFTAKFVEALEVPGLSATELFRRVRREVHASSNAEQWPAVYDDLLSDFVFRSPASVGVGPAGDARPVVVTDSATTTIRLQQETVFWESIQESRTRGDFEAFLAQFPTGTFAGLARNRLAVLRATSGVSAAAPTVVDPPRDVTLLDVAELRAWAEQGDAGAQNELGERYETGRGVGQDYEVAVSWFRLAADQGDARGQGNLGAMYFNGTGVPRDDEVAVSWFRRAAEQGGAGGQTGVGYMYATGRGVREDAAEAVRWYRLAAEQGHEAAQKNLDRLR